MAVRCKQASAATRPHTQRWFTNIPCLAYSCALLRSLFLSLATSQARRRCLSFNHEPQVGDMFSLCQHVWMGTTAFRIHNSPVLLVLYHLHHSSCPQCQHAAMHAHSYALGS